MAIKIYRIILLSLIFSLLSFTTIHKYYLSLTQIEYVKASNAIQITMNVFIDDMEVALNKTFNVECRLNTERESKESANYFDTYLNENFKVKINGVEASTKYLGREYEGDIVYFYIEIENIQEVSSIEVQNSILTDYFPEQQNLIKLKINGTFDSLLLTKKNNKGLLNF